MGTESPGLCPAFLYLMWMRMRVAKQKYDEAPWKVHMTIVLIAYSTAAVFLVAAVSSHGDFRTGALVSFLAAMIHLSLAIYAFIVDSANIDTELHWREARAVDRLSEEDAEEGTMT